MDLNDRDEGPVDQGSSGPMDGPMEQNGPSMDDTMGQATNGSPKAPTGPTAGIAEEDGPPEPTSFEEPQQTTSQGGVSLLPQIGSTTLSQLPEARQLKSSTVPVILIGNDQDPLDMHHSGVFRGGENC